MRRRSTRVAWAMLAAWSASVAALVVLSVANGNFQRQPLANTVGLLLAFAAFMGVGALIVANRPGNAIGWVFAAIALLAVTGALAEEYAGYAVRTRPGLLPGGVLAGWYAGWAWYPTVALALVFTPLLFPDGRPPSPPWRLVAWLTGAVTALFAALATGSRPIELDDGPWSTTRRGRRGSLIPRTATQPSRWACWSWPRWRRWSWISAAPAAGLQLKWFTYAGAVLPLVTRLPALDGQQRAVRRGDHVPAGRRRDRDPAPAVRHRPADQPDPGLQVVAVCSPGLRRPGLVRGLSGEARGTPSWVVAGPLAVAALGAAAGSRRWWTGASTGAATTPPGPSRRSAPACATRSTWTRCRPSCWPSWTRRCSRPGPPSGCGRRPRASRRPGRR